MPPLEALSCGAPVVVARSSSLPEVVGEHAIFANPYDYKAIAEALEQGVDDNVLRERLKTEGVQHAQRLSWRLMTEQTPRNLRTLAAGNSPARVAFGGDMRIGINARFLVAKRTGVQRAAYNLLRTLVQIDRTNEYFCSLVKAKL